MKSILTFLFLSLSIFQIVGQTKKDSLLVFVGQKISVISSPEVIPNDTIIQDGDTLISVTTGMDSRFLCRYKILNILNGYYKLDTISFYAYDHYGIPAFSEFNTVLLFVTPNNNKYYHQKYQYFDVYLADNGYWASLYAAGDYNHPFKNEISVKPELIKFKEEVSYPIDKLSNDDIQQWYPKPYYKIEKGKAIAVYGNYIEDLFRLKQQTILKARGIY